MRVSRELRTQIVFRAAGRSEYCLIHQDDSAFQHEVDHVIGRQRGGRTGADNLALSCLYCNRFKGSNLASIDSTGAPCASSTREGTVGVPIFGSKAQ